MDIARTAYTTVVVDAPGMGDDVQAIKAGIPRSRISWSSTRRTGRARKHRPRAAGDAQLGHRLRTTLHHGELLRADEPPEEPDLDLWQVPIVKTVATDGIGLDKLADAIDRHRAFLIESGHLAERQRAGLEAELAVRLREALLARLVQERTPAAFEDVIGRVLARQLDPGSAVRALLDGST